MYPETNLGAGAKWVKNLTQDRLSTFLGGHFSSVNLSSVLFTERLDDDKHVKLQVWSAPGRSKPTFQEAMKQTFSTAKKGQSFGPSWTNHWWKITLSIPSSFTKYERVQFEFDPGCEAMVFTTDGVPLQGITGGYGGDRRVEYIIPPSSVKKGSHDIIIESSCNGMFGQDNGGINPPDQNRYFTLASADLVVPNQEAWRLMWDFEALKQISESMPGNTSIQNQALVVANEMMNVFDHRDPKSVSRARKLAESVFGKEWNEKMGDIYKEGPIDDMRVWGIGHCHIDSAWLWPYSVTQQKVARSWSTQVDLMDRFPEHRFACSSAQQYKWLEQLYPELFKKVKEKVLSGQFQPVGGSWVENDGNMPSGEALARQLIFGQRYFESRFGMRCESAWLPDSFGYNGAFPQLIRLAGMDYFFTQKLSWNNINVFPHSTFNWSGIDGTQVLCHMTPVDTYTAQATAGDVVKAVNNHKNIESTDESLLVFGNGDGGGGPLPKMLENLRRMRAAANNSRELPVVHMGLSVDDFFKSVEKKTKGGMTLPVWHGELYFEFHRGTFTSHGSIKKGNRKSEILMRDVEAVATFASLFADNKESSKGYTYPKQKIDDTWEKLLLNQFHDVLPGSSIGMVYDDAEKYYSEIAKSGKEMLDDAFAALFPKSMPLSEAQITKNGMRNGKIFGYNSLPFPRQDVVSVPMSASGSHSFMSEVVQISKDKNKGYLLMDGTRGCGVTSPRGLFADVKPVSAASDGHGSFWLYSSNLKLTISDGRISSLIDLEQKRELIPKGQTGGLVWFEDRPNYWDAWDVEIHHLETPHELKFSNIRVADNGPLRASLVADASYDKSTIKVTISLDAIAATVRTGARPLIVFDAELDWHQRHEFLKFQIPLDLHSDNATYETPFGYVQRPTHKNTKLDMAKFEVCGHKYADLSEYGYGVALLSESKYGYSCIGNVLSMSLLRCATAPDAEQDQGYHSFSWAVMPHTGHFIESDVPIAAQIFNSPLHMRYTSNSNASNIDFAPPLRIENAPNVFLETVKRGDADFSPFCEKSGSTSVILRMYEAYGGHASACLCISKTLSDKIVSVSLTNLLEDEAKEAVVGEGMGYLQPAVAPNTDEKMFIIPFHGFQVRTVKLTFKASVDRESSRNSWVNVDVKKYIPL